ncbi:type II secretion system protein [Patescibacteria group bacterium]
MIMFKRNKGFTLIELLVVIAIIGVLASVVLASFNNARKKSRDARRVADIKQLQLALELFFDASNAYPTDAQGLAILATNGHIAAVANDPLGSSESYDYEQCSATSYHLGASLEESTNPALANDRDSSPTSCTDLTGADEDTVTTGCESDMTARYCYDVSP